MTNPDQYDRFTRGECDQKHNNKCIDVIYGWKKKNGKETSEVQALRYSTKVWTEADARAHCKERGGAFEAAKKSEKGGSIMEMTKDGLKLAYPDLFAEIEKEAFERGVSEGQAKGKQEGWMEGSESERKRIQAVEAQLIPGHEKLIAALKYDGTTSGPEAALKILAAEKNLRSAIRTDLAADAIKPIAQPTPPVVDGDGVDPNLPVEERAKQRWDKTPAIRDEFNNNFNSYLAFVKADEAGYARILKKGGNRK